jgi:hypothetical protein
LRADQHEVVVHYGVPFHAKALRHELLFRSLIVDEHDIRIAATAHVERLPRT